MIVPKEAVYNIKSLNFTVIWKNGSNMVVTNYTTPVSSTDTYTMNTVPGRNYAVLVVGQGVDGTWTSEPCRVNFSTQLPSPECPAEAFEVNSENIRVKLELCSFHNGTESAEVICNSVVEYKGSLDRIVYLYNVKPGSKASISISGVGQNGISSHPFSLQLYTKPSDPNCSKLSYSTTNESIEVDTNNMMASGAIQYRITMDNNTQIKSTEDTYLFRPLVPGQMYSISVSAIGAGNQTSQNTCTTKIYTRPTNPVCSAIDIHDRTTESLELSLERMKTNGADYYFAEYNNRNNKYYVNFGKQHGSKENIMNITGLISGTEYTFFVFAASRDDVNSSGSCVLRNYTYPNPPSEITNITTGKTNFYIKWRRSEGNVDAYNVTVSCNCSCNPKVTHSGSDTEAYVSDLKPGTHCGVTIVAISGGLYSIPFHFPHIKTIEKVPGKVSNVSISDVQSDGFTLSWEQPNSPNGDLLSYNINIKPGSNFTTDSLTTSFPFSNLTPGTCYNVTIAAVNSAGEGAIETKTVYTTEQAPSMVQDLKIKNTSSTSINVKWNKPLFPNGVVRWYIILVQKVKEEGCEQLIEFKCENCQNPCPDAETNAENENLQKEYYPNDRNASSCPIHLTSNFKSNDELLRYNITGLEIFTEYFVSVAAYTNKGGGENATSNITTSADKPSQPGKPVLMNLNISNVSFKYSKPEHQNGIIRNQEIEYSHVPYDECLSEQKGETVLNTTVQSIQENGKMYLASLENLKSFWEYSIRVRVKTYAGYSNYSELLIIRTFPSTPEKVSNITSKSLTSRGVILSWIQPCHPNGIIRNYRIEIKNEFNISVSVNNTNSNQTSFNVTGLLPFRNYTISIFTEVVNVTKRSPPATSERFQTLTEAPLQPGEIKINETTASSVRVSWDHPPLKTGPTRYEVSAIDKTNDVLIFTCKTRGFENTSCVIEGLDAFWNYSLIVKVYTGDFDPNNTTSKVETGQSAPGPVASFSVNQDPNVTTKTNVHVKWKQPTKRNLNGIIRNYFIQYWYSQSNKKIEKKCGKCYDAVIDVEPEKNYIFEIFAMTIENATEKNYLRQNLTTEPGAPLPLPPSKIPLIQLNPSVSDDQNQISVAFSRLALCDEKNGKIRQWFVIVSKESKGSPSIFYGSKQKYMDYITNNYKTWRDVYEKEESHTYIASDSWKPRCDESNRMRRSVEKPVAFKLGSDEKCSTPKYCNGPLEAGKTYRVKFGKCTNKGCLESEYSSPFTTAPNNVPVIAGSVAAVVLALIVIILVIVFLKRRRKGPIKDPSNGDSGQENVGFSAVEMTTTTKPPKAVRIADFANYVQKMHADSNLLFSQEYKLLKETCATHTTKAAEIQVNRIKNRYTNILAYDHSRVKLLPTEDDEGSDYINANYIPGFSSQREYIATQGPLPFTRDEFWRMIWEQNVSIVVMLTQLVERGRRKCDIYWPETTREPVYYGDLVVETESESTLPDYVLRVMSIKLGDSRKTVKQFCYLAWPDMGIPETSETMLKFTKEVRSHLPHPSTNRGPLVVHCSAGVGRTGTFIAVDYLMQHVTSSDVVDIYNYVMKMRNNRPNMVQTEDQYIFIHDCIRDFVNRSDEDSDNENEEEGGDDPGNPIYANM